MAEIQQKVCKLW